MEQPGRGIFADFGTKEINRGLFPLSDKNQYRMVPISFLVKFRRQFHESVYFCFSKLSFYCFAILLQIWDSPLIQQT